MADPNFPHLVSTQWLAGRLTDPTVRVVDATFHMPGTGRDARAEFAREHIQGAAFFDIDEVADRESDLPHMLPSPQRFAEMVGELGIGNADTVVAYDAHGLMSAARAWWMFRVFGHDRVAVLDGGLPKWRREGLPIVSGSAKSVPGHFTARFRSELVRSADDIERNLVRKAEQVVDARSPGRFAGTETEPRPGLRSGHIPGSHNVPFTALIHPETKTLKSPDEIARIFADAGVDLSRPVATSCGSGVTACVLALGVRHAGGQHAAVYDGSWAEWGLPSDRPVETGPRR